MKFLKDKTKQTVATAARLAKDAVPAVERAKVLAEPAMKEVNRLGKVAVRSKLSKHLAGGMFAGFVLGNLIYFVVPDVNFLWLDLGVFSWPGCVVLWMAVGGGFSVWRYMRRPPSASDFEKPDMYAELIKLDELRQKGIVNEGEFEAKKKKILEDDDLA